MCCHYLAPPAKLIVIGGLATPDPEREAKAKAAAAEKVAKLEARLAKLRADERKTAWPLLWPRLCVRPGRSSETAGSRSREGGWSLPPSSEAPARPKGDERPVGWPQVCAVPRSCKRWRRVARNRWGSYSVAEKRKGPVFTGPF